MPKIKEVKVYTFDELEEDVQQKVLERFAQYAYEDTSFEFECMVGDAKESASFKLTEVSDNPISGDGSFISDAETTANTIIENHGEQCRTYIVAAVFLKEFKRLTAERDSCQEQIDTLEANKDQDEWTAGDNESYRQNDQRLGELEEEIEELEQEFENDIAHEYGSMWSRQLEYLVSEEALKEMIDANDHEFLEDGRSARF